MDLDKKSVLGKAWHCISRRQALAAFGRKIDLRRISAAALERGPANRAMLPILLAVLFELP